MWELLSYSFQKDTARIHVLDLIWSPSQNFSFHIRGTLNSNIRAYRTFITIYTIVILLHLLLYTKSQCWSYTGQRYSLLYLHDTLLWVFRSKEDPVLGWTGGNHIFWLGHIFSSNFLIVLHAKFGHVINLTKHYLIAIVNVLIVRWTIPPLCPLELFTNQCTAKPLMRNK